ncbi:MAG TPA: bifunctional hydroxymethylpyrimidine kinase/phosphomethylpyrimidine kinase [Ideonella sp.]|uniref:bifunctional hydroxymethylpyrimidine kinase/phosphomethylpyrimidine kinase n=1 Tax=Ideonella sp. TaxID=1929293 RepID=UPI002C0E6EC0|nr:bifunctional hydroxymethylpyrimidine kinase/phosphomethylpyrimidine kinase [Ideonella sp.]HSI52157.1 bifunctional hydroxymethylpyrimidine kinase/phosphomethylpyrimidine kinase [Ideonella sp.]
MPESNELPRIASVAGTDSGGGAGLAADQRAADAFGVHLCPVVAAVTAQNSVAVTHVEAMPPTLLQAQLDALADDLPPRVLKTGLLGSAANARIVARWVDQQRRHSPLALVVDPVLRASTGAAFADTELLAVYCEELLPRATLVTPNQREASTLLGTEAPIPDQAAALRRLGVEAVLITGGDAPDPQLALDWLDAPHAQGWLSLPRIATRHTHGTGCTLASAAAAALAHGFTSADAAVLAKQLTAHALRQATPQGQGAGPVRAMTGWSNHPTERPLPRLHIGTEAPDAWSAAARPSALREGLYGIADSAERIQQLLHAGLRQLQLRIKRPPGLTGTEAERWQSTYQAQLRQSLTACDTAGAILWINDHWQLALATGARALHLGQEDLLALTESERRQLRQAQANGIALGLSSHSPWELARAAAWTPDYIACGPVWPTTTKDMPWRPQGLDNLAWWAANAPAPVVAIGGVLAPEQAGAAKAAGAHSICVVRGWGPAPSATILEWRAAMISAAPTRHRSADWPHATLPPAPA